MKKIMKKVLSLALVVALAMAPMVVNAASSADVTTFAPTETPTTYTIQYDHVDNPWTDGYIYTWSPATNGVLTLSAVSNNAWVSIEDSASWFDNATLDPNAPGAVTFNVSAGKTYKITVMNWDEVDGEVQFSASFAEGAGNALSGSGTMMDPYDVTNVTEIPSIGFNETKYYLINADNSKTYNLSVRGGGMMDYFDATVQMGETISAMMGNAAFEGVAPFASGAIIFTITNTNMMGGGPYTYILEENVSAPTIGTVDQPDTLVLDTLSTADAFNGAYFYEYQATEAGTLSINMYDNLNSAGWVCSISGGASESVYMATDEQTVVNPVEYVVAAGETITVWVATETFAPGQVYFQASFEAGATGGGNPGGQIPGGNQPGGDNYVVSNTALQVGENNDLQLDGSYQWTLFEFTPDATGVYKFQADDGVIGYWGAGTHFLTEPDDADLSNLVEKPITAVGQTIVVGIKDVFGGNTVGIRIEKVGEAQVETIDWTTYKNTIKPTEYKYDGDVDKLLETYVDTTDKVVDKAVLGKDGYYHLNSENGEILYVNLNDSLMSLVNIVSKSKLSAVYYDKDGKVTEAIDYTTAILEYLGVKDIAELEAKNFGTNPVIYPLTADLMTMFQKVGETNDWYGANGFIKGTEAEDAWMFACYYVKGQTTSSTPAPGTTVPSPDTGDHSNVAVWAIVMVVAAGAAFVVAESKRRAR